MLVFEIVIEKFIYSGYFFLFYNIKIGLKRENSNNLSKLDYSFLKKRFLLIHIDFATRKIQFFVILLIFFTNKLKYFYIANL